MTTAGTCKNLDWLGKTSQNIFYLSRLTRQRYTDYTAIRVFEDILGLESELDGSNARPELQKDLEDKLAEIKNALSWDNIMKSKSYVNVGDEKSIKKFQKDCGDRVRAGFEAAKKLLLNTIDETKTLAKNHGFDTTEIEEVSPH
eukprot:GHVO01021915.1.p2 GENE.GHVO01021915.1~~GHVO01021915.1.p2  ORF type:complete len:144 (+),score=18.06 GHVO01021915.1:771-1202(+)